jgi:hypothetical protein
LLCVKQKVLEVMITENMFFNSFWPFSIMGEWLSWPIG